MRRTTLAAGCAVLVFTLTSCTGGGDRDGAEADPGDTSAEQATVVEPDPVTAFGPDCADFPREGPGSLAAMAEQSLTDAVAATPLLERLSFALDRSGLAPGLDAAEDLTLFAPINDAFDMYPDPEIHDLFSDPAALARLLGRHVVLDEVAGADLSGATFETLGGARIRTDESEGEYTVDGYAPVVCADVRTADATVHVASMLLIPS
ncbi:fasciclin domain-containing protein [Nocardiopsis sp. MG754419]|uniref:fasciclin domain-containing protein n=1 Tax=Nocardiopsis sp. MG754419 TaxID=2259865 RepID=UPI001BA92290|nr:fasciclin domain-containing protein [Nocardiopsis sp. MG754419]MBR8740926.1 fasciclin domain protein [Nocardiopsis sp. MG754419]